MSEFDVKMALRLSKNNTSCGLDGIPYELYKMLNNKAESAQKGGNEDVFDVIELLTAAYNDIAVYGIDPNTNFAAGCWMCPLYKKNDRTEIANYRPITVLNTDYKIMTKVLAIHLAHAAPHLLHESQAGFVPGRLITDQTKLIRMIMDYTEVTEENGLLVALDQEKAYDKIDHEYLWKTLRKFKLPEAFITTVRHLYNDAHTKVMVNGHLSSDFKVKRGVRQGDPLSCLLFDLAIEPLAAMLRNSDLKGYKIPGHKERLIANLFADDTTVFLSADDDFETLQRILDKWCIASKAKFNIAKTEIIPMGSAEYRARVIDTRITKDGMDPLPQWLHITVDGEATRILGGWFGNNINNMSVWAPTLEKIDTHLERWNKGAPTMEGRRHIVQMVIGNMTQYLTQVQGMPTQIEKRVTKRVQNFIWAEKERNPVSKATVLRPIEQGGRKVLDIEARNKAIDVMWAKAYLNFEESRPLWAKVADKLFWLHTPKARTEQNVDQRIKVNPLLQTWKTSPPKHLKTAAATDLHKLITSVKEFGIRQEGIAFSRLAMREMPIWYHRHAEKKIRQLNHSAASECLRSNHKMITVGQAEELAARLHDQNHHPDNLCLCPQCIYISSRFNCIHPHACMLRAKDLLDTLPQKWDPRHIQPEDHEPDKAPETESKDTTIFDPRVTVIGSLSDTFRIFTEGDVCNDLPDLTPNQELTIQTTTVATDGSCTDNGRKNARAGAGVFFGENDDRNQSIRLPGHLYKKTGAHIIQLPLEQSNQTGEVVAVKVAAEIAPLREDLTIETDSKYAQIQLTSKARENEDNGYIGVKNRELLKAAVGTLRQRKSVTIFEWVKGHDGHAGNEAADELASIGAGKETLNVMVFESPRTLTITGAKLNKMTQVLAYQAIRERKISKEKRKNGPRRRTVQNLEKVKAQVEEAFEFAPKDEGIWKAIRHKDLARKTRNFLWMATHDAYMTGSHWQRASFSSELKGRATCQHDDQLEDMEHILTSCESPGQSLIWEFTQKLWEKKSEKQWYRPGIGAIIGAATGEVINSQTGRRISGETRLWRILITESAYLIWVLRCERVIANDNKPFTEEEIENRWWKMINERFKLDARMTSKKYEGKAISRKLVEDTWKGLLHDEEHLPEDWINLAVVLVGIEQDLLRRTGSHERRGRLASMNDSFRENWATPV
ncbi:hypothetical protein D9758_013247 [Tetrapyrgos nigripes]|uniref:Reverse transcriptase domain-containing protein n=1 Tax=Tetrapyrgos nigripes TaxID=182062 RepID=A0A8H5FP20_9AGAR|nr:hypothetical protein D9758_013247 [Tetrapyrgos nigripes]